MTKQEYYDEQRALYMDGKLTFEEFYTWLGRFIGLPDSIVFSVADRETIQNALKTDNMLNNIPLKRWDRQDAYVRTFCGGLSWSLSDTVCVLKQRAKNIVEA